MKSGKKKRSDVEEWIASWPAWERKTAFALLSKELGRPIVDDFDDEDEDEDDD